MPAILALDVGEARTGIAVGSTESGLARPHSVLRSEGTAAMAARLRRLLDETGATAIVVGLPHQPDGSVSAQGERIRRYVEGMAADLAVAIVFRDETLSTQDAQEILRGSGKGRRRRRELEDAVAAALVLQGYLDSLREKPPTLSEDG